MRKLFFLSSLVVLLLFNQFIIGQNQVGVYYISFKPTDKIEGNPVRVYPQDSISTAAKEKITIFPQIRYQTITGIGGCFNENGGEALLSLPKEKQQEIMRNLFDETAGCGFNFCRTAIGASDFGLDAYSYSETAGDYNMSKFSIDRDKKYVLPYIKSALAVNPNMKLFASPWSPPAWMKVSGKMVGVRPDNTLKDSAKIYTAYALYLAKYIKAYAKEGVMVSRIHPQNETDMNSTYPSCVMTNKEMSNLVMNYLIMEFKRSKVKTEIWAGTYRTYGKLEALELFADKKFRNSVSGVGLQYTKPIHLNDFRASFPNVKMMHTEGKCYNGDNSMKQAQARWTEIADYLNGGVENYAYWNMILNETGKSAWNWKQNGLINIDRSKGTVTYNPDYAVMYLVSKFIRPGDVRIGHFTTGELTSVVLKNAKGNYTVVLQNDAETDKTVSVQTGEAKVQFVRIPALALAAVVIEQNN
jgi:glucosylceramidase